jgi:hypothetical protein
MRAPPKDLFNYSAWPPGPRASLRGTWIKVAGMIYHRPVPSGPWEQWNGKERE